MESAFDMLSGFKTHAKMAAALAALVATKKPPDMPSKDPLFAELQSTAETMGEDARVGKNIDACLAMLYVTGLGLGLGTLTREELDALQREAAVQA